MISLKLSTGEDGGETTLLTHIGQERELLRQMIAIHYTAVDRLFRLYILLVSVPAVATSLAVREGNVSVRLPDLLNLDPTILMLLGSVGILCILIYRMVVEHHLKRLLYIRALNALRAPASAAAHPKRVFVLPTDPKVPHLFRLGADYFYEAGAVALANGALFALFFFNLLRINGHFDIRRADVLSATLTYAFVTTVITAMHFAAHSRAARRVERQYWNEPKDVDDSIWESTRLRASLLQPIWRVLTSERFGSVTAAAASLVAFSFIAELLVFLGIGTTGPYTPFRVWHELALFWPLSSLSGLVGFFFVLSCFWVYAGTICALHWRGPKERLFLLTTAAYISAYAFLVFPVAIRNDELLIHSFLLSGWPAFALAVAGYCAAACRYWIYARYQAQSKGTIPPSPSPTVAEATG